MAMIRLLVMADGRSVHTERWCRYFEETGYEVALFSLEPKTISAPKIFYGGKRRTPWGIIDYALAKGSLAKSVASFRPDIINPHFVASYGWLASFCHKQPVVATAWGSDLLLLPDKSFIHRRRVKRALAHAVCCTVDNKNLFDAAARYMSPDKILTVRMGVDRDWFEKSARTDFSTGGALRIIAPRGLQEVYDPATIVQAAGLLHNKIDFNLTLFGNDPLAADYEARIEQLGLGSAVTIHPFVPHDVYLTMLPDYGIYLSASLSDSTSVALLEAMAAGLIPVVSDIEGNREWIEHDKNGFLFTPRSPDSLAEAILFAQARRDEFASMAAMNRQKVRADAIWQDNMAKVDTLFKGLVG
jgi:L-malate glycosyltransferase